MNSNEEVNTYNTSAATLPHFWRNPITWRSTSTGMNENVIGTYNPHSSKKLIILHMRKNAAPYTDGRKYLNPEEKKKHDYFTLVVNECMDDIWHGKGGYVFTDSQLMEVMRILPSVDVEWSEYSECYYCWKR